ncbi:MAG: hypothetical protein AB1568_06310 [Thermodesulfobacteriota bacterium]
MDGIARADRRQGFPSGEHALHHTVIKQPPPWSEVEQALIAAGRDIEFIGEVKDQWVTRWQEWYGKGADEVTGAGGIGGERAKWLEYENNGIPYPANSVDGVQENIAKGFSVPADDLKHEQRLFHALEVTAPDGRKMLVPTIFAPNKGWQGVVGDIDLMAIVDPIGNIVPPEARLQLYRELRELGIQHPETLTWENALKRDEQLRKHLVGDPSAEALAAYHPDGRVTATYLDPGRSWIDPQQFRLRQALYFRGATTAYLNATKVTPSDMSSLAPLAEDRGKVYVPPGRWNNSGSACTDSGQQGTAGICAANTRIVNDASALVLRQRGIGAFEQWTETGGWQPYTPTSPTINVLPQTILPADFPDPNQGWTDFLTVPTLADLGLNPDTNDWFRPGQEVIIDPDGEHPERHTIWGAIGPRLLLYHPMFPHPAGTPILAINSVTPGFSSLEADTIQGEAPLTVTFTCLPPADSAFAIAPDETPEFDFDGDGVRGFPSLAVGREDYYFPDHAHQERVIYSAPGIYSVTCWYYSEQGYRTWYSITSRPLTITVTAPDPRQPWDCNGNGIVDLPDATCQLLRLSDLLAPATQPATVQVGGSGPDPRPWDCNANNIVDLADLLCQLQQLTR